LSRSGSGLFQVHQQRAHHIRAGVEHGEFGPRDTVQARDQHHVTQFAGVCDPMRPARRSQAVREQIEPTRQRLGHAAQLLARARSLKMRRKTAKDLIATSTHALA
jgi:hypothetical protein